MLSMASELQRTVDQRAHGRTLPNVKHTGAPKTAVFERFFYLGSNLQIAVLPVGTPWPALEPRGRLINKIKKRAVHSREVISAPHTLLYKKQERTNEVRSICQEVYFSFSLVFICASGPLNVTFSPGFANA